MFGAKKIARCAISIVIFQRRYFFEELNVVFWKIKTKMNNKMKMKIKMKMKKKMKEVKSCERLFSLFGVVQPFNGRLINPAYWRNKTTLSLSSAHWPGKK